MFKPGQRSSTGISSSIHEPKLYNKAFGFDESVVSNPAHAFGIGDGTGVCEGSGAVVQFGAQQEPGLMGHVVDKTAT
jgi:hypothetical protein